MSFKPLVVNAGKVEQLQAGQAIDVDGGLNVNADDVNITLGESGAADSYMQFDGTVFIVHSSGLIVFESPQSYVQVVLRNHNVDTGTQRGGISVQHPTIGEEPVGILTSYCPVGVSRLMFGGGPTVMNAATQIEFYTASNNITQAGTKRLNIDSAGIVSLPADNQHLAFGAGVDASIYYDGTNMKINPKLVGSGILDVLGVLQTDGYNAADGTAGATATVACGLADVEFKNGLYAGHTLSGKAITVTAKVTSVTLTAAELVGGIVTDNTTVAGDTLTLPTGTAMDTELPSFATGESIVWSVINLDGTYPVAISAGSGHSIIGATTIAASSQAGFTSVRSGANTWVSYRTA